MQFVISSATASSSKVHLSPPWVASLLIHLAGIAILLSVPAGADRTPVSYPVIVTPLVYWPAHRIDIAPTRTAARRMPLVAPLLPRPKVSTRQLVVLPPPPVRPAIAVPNPEPVLLADIQPPVRLAAPELPSRPVPAIPVKTGVFSAAGNSPDAHVPSPRLEVQTGVFAGSGGVSGVRSSANGSGTGGSGVRTGGFGDATGGGARAGNGKALMIADAGFGNADAPAPPPPHVDAAPAEIPVEVLWKPKPLYTDEARAKKLEGNVTLEVVFRATGDVHVIRVVRGLGCGLDESARAAAEQIRFRPGKKDGVPVDRTGLVQITFELT